MTRGSHSGAGDKRVTVYPFLQGEASYTVRIEAGGRATIEGPSLPDRVIHFLRLDETTFEVRGEKERWRRIVHVVAADPNDDNSGWWVFSEGDVFELAPVRNDPVVARRPADSPLLSSPMPATVLRVQASPGQEVHDGDTLIVLEAMKMELPLRAPRDGVVESVACQEGDLVKPGAPLVVLRPVS